MALIGLLAPSTALLALHKKKGMPAKGVWNGVCVYVLFNAILNSFLFGLLTTTGAVADFFSGHLWLRAVVSGLLTALCMTAGRMLWLKTLVKSEHILTGVAFGGGTAAMQLLFVGGLRGVTQAVLIIMVLCGRRETISPFFEEQFYESTTTDVFGVFLTVFMMILLCVTETALGSTLYAVSRKKTVRFALPAVFLVQTAFYFVYGMPVMADTWRVLLLAFISLAAAGLGYVSLVGPKAEKTEG